MKLHIRNIGPISDIEFDVDSNLTFIYGKNNIGKSYAITFLYLILKNYVFDTPLMNRYPYAYDYFPMVVIDYKDGFKQVFETAEKENGDIDITDLVNAYFAKFISSIFSSGLSDSLRSSFGDISNLNNKISNGKFELCLTFSSFKIIITEDNNELVTKYDGYNRKYACRKVQRHLHPRADGDKTILYYNNEKQFMQDLQIHVFSYYRKSINEINSKINNVYYLPASRSGLYRALNAFSQILVELAKKRSFLHQKIILPSISEQDSDYFSRINEINTKRINQKFSNIASTIESKLLKGEVSFDQKTKQILFRPNNVDINLELLGTSSMIAEVSPIVLYLRYIIGSDDDVRRRKDPTGSPIIFIEEPEAHLHPEAQVELIECFIDLVKSGAKLVITSHSNYIFNKLNNLIAEKKIDQKDVKGYLFFQSDNGSCCKSIPINDFGMDDGNFVDIAEKLYNEKLSIIDKME